MSRVACKYCGVLRTVEQVHYIGEDGRSYWSNSPCYSCDAPGWEQPSDADPFDSQPPPVAAGVSGDTEARDV